MYLYRLNGSAPLKPAYFYLLIYMTPEVRNGLGKSSLIQKNKVHLMTHLEEECALYN